MIGSSTTALYSAMSLLYFLVQVLVLISAADVNNSSGQLIQSVLQEARISTNTDFAYLQSVKKGGRLQICPGIASTTRLEECPVVFPVQDLHGPIAITTKRDEEYTMVPVFQGNNLTSFMMLEASNPGELITLPPVCLRALEWPYQTLLQTRRADITVAGFQTWLFILSTVAIFCQSIPHIISTLFMHVLALVWSSSQIAATLQFRSDYGRLITGTSGACDGVDLLVGYFKNRLSYEIAMTVINVVTLAVSAYLSWRLFLIYGWTNFKDSNSSPIIRKAYIFALGLSTIVQLGAFFQATSIALWLDEITNHIMGATSKGMIAYLVLYIALILSLGPWFYFAWCGIRDESKRMMIGFLVVSVVYIAGFVGMFASDTFRQTVVHWSFFGAVFVITCILVLASIILAVLCQLNFGIGLHRYLDPSGTGGFRDSSAQSIDVKGDMETGAGEFAVKLPGEKTLQREGSVSSNSSTLRSENSYGYTKGLFPGLSITAAEPGSIKILPPVPAAVGTDSPRKGASTPLTPLKKYGREFWGRTKRDGHESAMSFGHMDASKLDHRTSEAPVSTGAPMRLPISLAGPFTLDADSFSHDGSQLSTPAAVAMPNPSQRVDSMGSIYSTNSNKPRLVLVTAL